MSDTPIYDSLCAIYRYDGGWAFEDNCPSWRPWSDAWEELCYAPFLVGYRDMTGETEKLRQRLLMYDLFKSVTHIA